MHFSYPIQFIWSRHTNEKTVSIALFFQTNPLTDSKRRMPVKIYIIYDIIYVSFFTKHQIKINYPISREIYASSIMDWMPSIFHKNFIFNKSDDFYETRERKKNCSRFRIICIFKFCSDGHVEYMTISMEFKTDSGFFFVISNIFDLSYCFLFGLLIYIYTFVVVEAK